MFGGYTRLMLHNVSAVKWAMGSFALLGFSLLVWLFTIVLSGKAIEPPSWQTRVNKSNLVEVFSNSSVTFASCDYENEDLYQIIASVTRMLGFIEKLIDDVAVLDAAFGTRVLESQMRLFQLGHPNLPQSFQGALQFIQNWSKQLSEMIIQKLLSMEIPKAERNHMLRNLYWVNDTELWDSPSIGNWRSDFESKMILLSSDTIDSILLKGLLMSEDTWDNCIADVFQECAVTDECAYLFMEKIGSLYPLTHQIFYHFFAQKKNCLTNEHFKKKMGNRSPGELMHRMCNKVWQEAHAIQVADFPILYRDLLTEQVTVCSLLGYTQFLKVSWLKRLLSWQSETGCYSDDSSIQTTSHRNSKENKQTQNSNTLHRVKRSDNKIQMGSEKCSVHFTSVALSAMAMHVRYLGDTCLRHY